MKLHALFEGWIHRLSKFHMSDTLMVLAEVMHGHVRQYLLLILWKYLEETKRPAPKVVGEQSNVYKHQQDNIW